jgi:hypothetical protein
LNNPETAVLPNNSMWLGRFAPQLMLCDERPFSEILPGVL